MRKILFLLAACVVVSGAIMGTDAATKKRKTTSTQRRKSPAAKIVATAGEYVFYENGKLRSKTSKCIGGEFSKKQAGYYDVIITVISSSRDCGDGYEEGIIVDDRLYMVGGGTDGCLEYTYNHAYRTVDYHDNCNDSVPEWTEYLSDMESIPVVWTTSR